MCVWSQGVFTRVLELQLIKNIPFSHLAHGILAGAAVLLILLICLAYTVWITHRNRTNVAESTTTSCGKSWRKIFLKLMIVSNKYNQWDFERNPPLLPDVAKQGGGGFR